MLEEYRNQLKTRIDNINDIGLLIKLLDELYHKTTPTDFRENMSLDKILGNIDKYGKWTGNENIRAPTKIEEFLMYLYFSQSMLDEWVIEFYKARTEKRLDDLSTMSLSMFFPDAFTRLIDKIMDIYQENTNLDVDAIRNLGRDDIKARIEIQLPKIENELAQYFLNSKDIEETAMSPIETIMSVLKEYLTL